MRLPVVVSIHIATVASGRRSEGRSLLDLSRWLIGSMIPQAAIVLAERSSIEPVCRARLSKLRQGLTHLSPEAVTWLDRPMHSLLAAEVRPLLRSIDEGMHAAPGVSKVSAAAFERAIRQLLLGGPDTLADGESFRALVATYLPTLRGRPVLPRNPLPSTLGHLPHTDWDDLRRVARLELQQRNDAIERAVDAEIALYDQVVTQQKRWLSHRLSQASQSIFAAWLLASPGRREHAGMPSLAVADVVAGVLQRDEVHVVRLDENGWPSEGWYPGHVHVKTVEGVAAYQLRGSMAPWFAVRQRLPNAVLIAAFIGVVLHTGWNQCAVGELTTEGITRSPQGGYRLQSYKGKTDDDTPVVEVYASSRRMCRLIDLLLWNLAQLKAMGLVPPEEVRLWFGWQRNGFANTTNVVDTKRVRWWRLRHGLPVFSMSDLRPLRAALTYLPQRDLEAVRVLLGHRDLRMSDAYLEDTLFFRLNEANMLQFQRRIETSLTYAVGGDALVAQRGLQARDIDTSLMRIPTGDGGVCTERQPPKEADQSRPVGAPCAALRCQADGGCPHYRLHVDAHTLEMALRTRAYYRARWSVLAAMQPEAFSKWHLPRLLYIHVLLRIVHDQRPDLLRLAEAALT